MRVLVVGGTGLFSTAITGQLLERGDDVTLYNRGKTASRLPAVADRAHVLIGDRTEHAAFEAQVRDAGEFDCVIDMVGFRAADAASVVRAFGGRVRQLIFCSTTSVYATPSPRYPVDEGAPPSTTLPYGANKALCERILLEAHARGDFQAVILRPAHVYGEGQGMLNSLGSRTAYIDRLRRQKPVVVHGDGTSLWSALHAEDVARAFVAAAGNEAAAGGIFNIAAEEWLTWNAYNELVAEAAGAPPPHLVHIPTDVLARIAPEAGRRCRDSYQYSKIFDTAAARDALGFRQLVPFVEGVRRTVAWLDAHGGIEPWESEPWYDRIVDRWTAMTDRLADSLSDDAAAAAPG